MVDPGLGKLPKLGNRPLMPTAGEPQQPGWGLEKSPQALFCGPRMTSSPAVLLQTMRVGAQSCPQGQHGTQGLVHEAAQLRNSIKRTKRHSLDVC